MSRNKNDLIKISNEPDTFVKTSRQYDVKNEKVSFSFDEFNTSSVKNERINYNSYYQNTESSRNAVNDFFKTIKELSKYKIGDLMSSKSLKETLHLNLIDREEHIERIEIILKDDYGYPQGKIDEYDKEYYEFQISDGKRVIWHKVDNVIHPLFIDCNHMVCIDSSKTVKAKMKYSIESSFSHLNEDALNTQDKSIVDFIAMIIEDFELGQEVVAENIVDLLKDCINYDKRV